MKATIAIALLLATASTACVSDAHTGVAFDNRSDRDLGNATQLAAAATRARGYTIADEDDTAGAFVAVAADARSGMFVQVAKPTPLPWHHQACFNGCDTEFAITPLVAANGRLVVEREPTAASQDAAWHLASAINRTTLSPL